VFSSFRAFVIRFCRRVFRGRVAGSAHDLPALALPGVMTQLLGQTKVGDLRRAPLRQQHVGRLQVDRWRRSSHHTFMVSDSAEHIGTFRVARPGNALAACKGISAELSRSVVTRTCVETIIY
jgi:hypothetical protein